MCHGLGNLGVFGRLIATPYINIILKEVCMKATLILGGLLFAFTMSVSAHHPFDDEFDWKKAVTLTGTVTKTRYPEVRGPGHHRRLALEE